MKIWNLTPHVIVYERDGIRREFPSDGKIRIGQINTPLAKIDGMEVNGVELGDLEGVPDDVEVDDVVIVSSVVGSFAKQEPFLFRPLVVLCPDTGPTAKRNAEGQIESVSQFIRMN